MPTLIGSTQAFLILLAAFGFYTTWYLIYNNGTSDMMEQIRDQGPHLLPGTKAPLKRDFTGVKPIDYQLTVLVLFFWEQVDGSLPNASLFCFMFAGQAVAAWTLIYVEGQRRSNRWRIVSFVMCWGLAIQMGSFALLMPIHLAIHLSTSPTVTSRKADDFAVKAPQLLSIPLSFVIGFLVPAVALALPAPSILSYSQKQSWIAAWQVFPIWMEISQQILSFVIPKLSSSSSTKRQSQRYSSLDTIRALRVVYVFALVVVGVTHITTFAISITSKLFPAIFTPEFRGVLDPTKVSLPASPFPLKKITSLGKGAFQLLQYDEICGSAALLVWSAALLVKKYNEIQCFGFGAALKMLAATVGLTLLFGPCGCAIALTWARDELVFDLKTTDEKKSS